MKRNTYIAPALTIVEMDTEDLLTVSIVKTEETVDDEAAILTIEEEDFGWKSTLWDDDEDE